MIENGAITRNGIYALEPYRAKRAIFIAVGFGTRLIPITLNTPKPLVRVHGIRIIDRLIDACLKAGINEIYVVRGYLAELFDQLTYTYPMIQFLENPAYDEANNISSALVARGLLSNAYVFEADLLLHNPSIIKKYQYRSNFLGVRKERSDDWCFRVKDGIIIEEKVGGQGDDIWEMIGISYWNEADGHRLFQDIADVYTSPGGKERFWEQVPLVYRKDKYTVEIRECDRKDIIEIDTYKEAENAEKALEVLFGVLSVRLSEDSARGAGFPLFDVCLPAQDDDGRHGRRGIEAAAGVLRQVTVLQGHLFGYLAGRHYAQPI